MLKVLKQEVILGFLNQYKHLVSRFPSDLMKSTVVDESLSSFKPMYCSRENQASTRLSQQYEKSTSKDKLAHCHTGNTTQNPSAHRDNIEYH